MSVAAESLREGLLAGVSPLVLGADGPVGSCGLAVREALEQLGARVEPHAVGDRAVVSETALDAAVANAAAAPGGLDVLVVDGAALFALGGLQACLAGSWEATRAVVNGAFLPTGRGGRIVYLAPAPGAGEQADAARAGLENLARTLSVEWARHAITVVTIALGDGTAPGEAAALVAFLASPAGAYFSGCQLDLRGASEPSTRRRPASLPIADRGIVDRPAHVP